MTLTLTLDPDPDRVRLPAVEGGRRHLLHAAPRRRLRFDGRDARCATLLIGSPAASSSQPLCWCRRRSAFLLPLCTFQACTRAAASRCPRSRRSSSSTAYACRCRSTCRLRSSRWPLAGRATAPRSSASSSSSGSARRQPHGMVKVAALVGPYLAPTG